MENKPRPFYFHRGIHIYFVIIGRVAGECHLKLIPVALHFKPAVSVDHNFLPHLRMSFFVSLVRVNQKAGDVHERRARGSIPFCLYILNMVDDQMMKLIFYKNTSLKLIILIILLITEELIIYINI